MNPKVCIVIVTYGKRWDFLSSVLSSVHKLPSVQRIIVVDNASEYNLIESISNNNFDKVEVVSFYQNYGSAYGYKVGIERASLSDCNYIWLLDDDNKPMENALDELWKNYIQLVQSIDKQKLALLSLREDRADYKKSALYGKSSPFFPILNSVFGFHFKQIPQKILKKIYRKIIERSNSIKDEKYVSHPVQIPYAPYGGLFFHKNIIDLIQLPNEKFYLYSDDHEFTYRLTKKGGKIFLIPSSQIKDIDISWHIKEKSNLFRTLLNSSSSSRVYYTVRNRIYFEMKDLIQNKRVYQTNLFLFRSILRLYSILTNNYKRYNLINHAIQAALRGELGKNENINL